MSATEELIEATVNADGSATVIIEGKTREFAVVSTLTENLPLASIEN